MGMWSKANTRETLRDRMGLGDGKVVRSLSEDEDFEEMGVWPARKRISREDRKAADKLLKEGKPKRGKPKRDQKEKHGPKAHKEAGKELSRAANLAPVPKRYR